VLLSGALEVAGIAAVTPFLAVVASPEVLKTHPTLSRVYSVLGFTSEGTFLVFAGLLMVFLVIASNALSVLAAWRRSRFAWRLHHKLSCRLLGTYLGKPYAFFLSRHSAELVRKILAEVQQLVTGVLMPMMEVCARGFAVLLILVLLVAVDVALAFWVASVLLGAYLAVYMAVRVRLRRGGMAKLEANSKRYRLASESLAGIKEVKVHGREEYFLDRFSVPSLEYSIRSASYEVTRKVPRYALETLAAVGVLLAVLYLLHAHDGTSLLLPRLGLYAFAGFRLMPGLQTVFQEAANIRFNMAVVPEIGSDLESSQRERRPDGEACGRFSLSESVAFRDVAFQYPGAQAPLFENLTLRVAVGSSIGLVGETGAGKTTLVDLLLGLLEPTAGEIFIDSIRLDSQTVPRWHERIGYVPQHIFLADDSIARNIAFGLPDKAIDRKQLESAAQLARIHDFIVHELPEGYETTIGERGVRLSGGQRQRLGIARALYLDPDLLVFDEATSALDNLTEDSVLQALRGLKGRKTLVIIAHRLSTVKSCDRILVLSRGQVVADGTFDELLKTSHHFRALAAASTG